jgi:hypothetical protein
MKNFLVLAVFLSTLFFGLIIAGSSDSTGKFNNFLHTDFALQTDETLDKSLFTLCEANRLSGKKIISKNRNFRKNRIGRIVSFEMVTPDGFLIEIYWGNGAEDENSTVTFHDKETFSRDFEVID